MRRSGRGIRASILAGILLTGMATRALAGPNDTDDKGELIRAAYGQQVARQ